MFKIRSMFTLLVAIVFTLLPATTNSANILCVFTTVGKSHLIIHESLAKGLVERGHNVTVVTILSLNKPNPGFEHIHIAMPDHQNHFADLVSKLAENKTANSIWLKTKAYSDVLHFFANYSADVCETKEMKALFETRSYDLVILGYMFNEIQLGIADHFQCPVIISWVNTNIVNTDSFVGNPMELSYISSIFIELKQPFGFTERLINFVGIIFEKLRQYDLLMYQEDYYRKLFPRDKGYRTFDQMLKNISLLMQATHFSNTPIKPMTVNTIEIGGVHIKENPDPLPNDIKSFLDKAKSNGAIYFSLGTNANSSDLNPSIIHTIYNVFKQLPQHIIWKWETNNVPGKATNIFYSKWLPQDDILAHPHIKLFISHGGLGGISEARHHAVPIVGLPLFGDQFINLKHVEAAGWGLVLDIQDLSEQSFSNAIQEVLHNNSYSHNIQKISKMYKDRMQSPMATAMYWIEYVLRYNGAPHIQSLAVQLPFWQLYSIDVCLFLYVAIYFVVFVVRKLFKLMFSFCCCNLYSKIFSNKEKIN